MVVAIWVEVRDAIHVVDGREHALLVLGAYLPACGRGGLDGRRGIGGYGRASSTAEGQLCIASREVPMYLEMPEPGSRSVPFLLNASSLSCGLSRSILVGLRGRGEWNSVFPL